MDEGEGEAGIGVRRSGGDLEVKSERAGRGVDVVIGVSSSTSASCICSKFPTELDAPTRLSSLFLSFRRSDRLLDSGFKLFKELERSGLSGSKGGCDTE
jgi:hypothetical protein